MPWKMLCLWGNSVEGKGRGGEERRGVRGRREGGRGGEGRERQVEDEDDRKHQYESTEILAAMISHC